MAKKSAGPPPMIDGSRVVEYAVIPKSVKYAIGEPVADGEVLLFHCDDKWRVVETSSHPSIRQAKHRAERAYPGITDAWTDDGLPRVECSFCGRKSDQVQQMIAKENVRICDICVRESFAKLNA
jgi:ClpX C4-type zinc finger